MSQQSGILRLLGKLKSSRSGSRRRVWIGLALAVLVIVVVLGWFHSRGTSFPPLPEPNGYDILVHGATRIVHSTNSVSKMSVEELEVLVAANRAALEEIQRGLELPCAVPVQMSEAWIRSQTRDLINLKGAATAMHAEAQLRQRRGDPQGSLEWSIQCLKLGQAVARRGVLISSMVGTACEGIGLSQITNLLNQLDAPGCRRAFAALEEQDHLREKWSEVLARELEWSRRTYGIAATAKQFIQGFVSDDSLSALARKHTGKPVEEYGARVRRHRRVLLELAARAFELEQGRQPRSASELVPSYLSSLPLDPGTEKPLSMAHP